MKPIELKGKTADACAALLGIDASNPALQRFAAIGLPDKKSEEYRYFKAEALFERDYEPVARQPRTIQTGERIVIEDGTVIEAPKGMRVYYDTCKALDTEHFDAIYYLSHAMAPQTIMIDLDGDAEVELHHRFSKPGALINYRIVIRNQANRHATLFETFEDAGAEGSLVLYGFDLFVAPDSTLRIVKNQLMFNEHYDMIASHRFKLDKRANAVYKTFDTGSGMGLQLFKAELDAYAHLEAGHLLYLNDTAQRGTVSKIVHTGEHSISNQEAKNILDGQARGIFDALIKVEHSAKYTKAHQNSKAILLDERAYMASKPQLEIYIDELEASHGSTTGQLDEKQLFYLRSRGINKIEARKMLVAAFANTLIEQIKDGRQQEAVKATFEEAFYAKHRNEG
jgi:Fe-S cluster assembly protein SufD